MVYLLCYDWLSTRGNHAGMSHLCDMLVERYPDEMVVIKNYQPKATKYFPYQRINRVIDNYRVLVQNWIFQKKFQKMLTQIKDGDTVLLMEYIHPLVNQTNFAKQIKYRNPNVKVVGLAHLTPSALAELNVGSDNMSYWEKPVDAIMTLGHSLSDWLIQQGVSEKKIITAFHYVDAKYYHRTQTIRTDKVRVICMGNLQRNFSVLEDIVKRCPDAEFTICAGKMNLPQFEKYTNVRLLGYLTENQLKEEMESANVSLNVMDDTVGSNVITTSMAMGLAMVVSDVGSIHDYCDETNAIFCKTVDDFVTALKTIDVKAKSEASLKKLSNLTIESFYQLLR